MSEPVVIEPVTQKDVADCGIACLAMVLSLPYQTVSAAFPKRRKVGHNGMSNRQLQNAARKLGHPLKYINEGQMFETVGILDLQRRADPANPKSTWEGHYAVQLKNVLFNPADGAIWTDIDAFLKTRRWELLGVFVRQDNERED